MWPAELLLTFAFEACFWSAAGLAAISLMAAATLGSSSSGDSAGSARSSDNMPLQVAAVTVAMACWAHSANDEGESGCRAIAKVAGEVRCRVSFPCC
jgi:hypothetical protein